MTSQERLRNTDLAHFDMAVRKVLIELCRMFKEIEPIFIMVEKSNENLSGRIIDLSTIVKSGEPILFLFSQTSRKIKSKLKVLALDQDKVRMIRNVATLQSDGIRLKMFSLHEGREIETLLSYDALR